MQGIQGMYSGTQRVQAPWPFQLRSPSTTERERKLASIDRMVEFTYLYIHTHVLEQRLSRTTIMAAKNRRRSRKIVTMGSTAIVRGKAPP